MDDTAAFPRARDKLQEVGRAERFQRLLRNLRQELFRSRRRRSQWWKLSPSFVVALAVLFLGLAGRVIDPPFVEIVRLKTFDLYQLLKPRPAEDHGVIILDLDEKSLHAIGQWPWPRSVLADMLERLADAGTAVVGFDAVFPEPDRTSPERIADTLRGAKEETLAELRALPSNEDAMARAMQRIPVVVGQVGLFTGLPDGKLAPTAKTSVKGEFNGDPRPFLFEYGSLLGNVPELEDAARGHGFFSIWDEVDGVVRRVPLVARIADGDAVRPALTIEMLRAGLGGSMVFTKRDAAGITSIGMQTPQGRFEIPTDEHGRIWVHFSEPDYFNTPDNSGRMYVSAGDVIQGKVPREKLAGKIAIVGTSAVGLQDIRKTPISPRLPGVEVHANILETILASKKAEARHKQKIVEDIQAAAAANGEQLSPQALFERAKPQFDEISDAQFYLRYLNYANSIEMALMLAAGVFMIVFIPRLGPFLTLSGILAAGSLLLGVSWYLYSEHLLLLDVSYPGIVTVALYSVLTFANYTREAAEKKQVRNAFSQYLSPDLVEQLADDPARLQLGGETKNMTILFCDVRGFTAISETFKSNPQGLTVLINRLLTPLTEAILAHKGTIDKYMGDCIMAFWNAPLHDDRHAVHSCEAALEMLRELELLNQELAEESRLQGEPTRRIDIGIGLNTGDVVVGNMGSQQRFDYSVLGDAVNLSARLEGQSKTYGVNIVLGPDTARSTRDDFAVLELDLIAVKGKTEAVDIYTLLGDAAYRSRPQFQALSEKHAAMLSAYRAQDWDLAGELIGACRALSGKEISGYYDMFEERILDFRLNPPGADWDGVFIATSK